MSAELLASLDDAERTPRHSISEVAELTGLTAHTLRWYERIGLLEPVDRTHAAAAATATPTWPAWSSSASCG